MAVYSLFPGGKRKAFTVSYDDGWPQDEKLIALMNQYGIIRRNSGIAILHSDSCAGIGWESYRNTEERRG